MTCSSDSGFRPVQCLFHSICRGPRGGYVTHAGNTRSVVISYRNKITMEFFYELDSVQHSVDFKASSCRSVREGWPEHCCLRRWDQHQDSGTLNQTYQAADSALGCCRCHRAWNLGLHTCPRAADLSGLPARKHRLRLCCFWDSVL